MKNTTKIGLDAEAKACEYLIGHGYKIIGAIIAIVFVR